MEGLVFGFEVKALHLLGRCSTTQAKFPALVALVIFCNRVSHFCPG
jgi:hypothetical protein